MPSPAPTWWCASIRKRRCWRPSTRTRKPRKPSARRSRIEQRNIRSARERVRHFLKVNAGADGRTVDLQGTLKDLAAELGLTHEALYRNLAALERSGEIKRAKGKIPLAQVPKGG